MAAYNSTATSGVEARPKAKLSYHWFLTCKLKESRKELKNATTENLLHGSNYQ
jgi:hypothetical protein